MSLKFHNVSKLAAATLIVGSTLFTSAHAVQFSYLDPAYEQDIYTADLPTGWGPGFAWNDAGNMILRGSNVLYEYSLADDTVYNGTDVHSYTAHAIAGLGFGYGMTNGTDGYVYANTSSGIQQIDLNTWTVTQTFAGSTGGTYGIGTLPDGRIVHNDNYRIWILDPTTGVDTLVYSQASFIDDIAVSPTGEIFLADLGSSRLVVINDTGTVINTVNTTHAPDGMAFGDGAAFANNTDGTITRIDFAGAGYTGAATETIFASGGNYGDLAAVGPDGAFYVSQWYGVDWGDAETTMTTGGSTIVRISLIGGGSTGGGGFDPSPGTGPAPDPTTGVPAPGAGILFATGILGMMFRRKKIINS